MTDQSRTPLRQVLSSLQHRNFRVYLSGQGLSHTGMWLQQTAELWLVLQLAGTGTALGIATALRFGPMLVLGAYSGLLGDRLSRHRLLVWTAVLQGLAAAVLAVAVVTDRAELWFVYLLVLIQGIFNAVDNPLRRGFVRDLVPDAALSNAVSLNGAVNNLARTVGPALGGLTIATVGLWWCFALNAASYAAVLVSLALIDRDTMRPFVPVVRGRGQLRDGVRYCWSNPVLRTTLILTAIVGTFGWNWNALLPAYATDVLAGGPELYGMLLATLSVGSLIGSLAAASRPRISDCYMLGSGAAIVVALLATAVAAGIPPAFAAILLLGAAGTSFTVAAQARLQHALDDHMNGRVMALFTVCWIGSKPVGGLIGGWIIDQAGADAAFGFGGVMVAVVVTVAAIDRRRRDRRQPAG